VGKKEKGEGVALDLSESGTLSARNGERIGREDE